jgi:hypothetical protein
MISLGIIFRKEKDDALVQRVGIFPWSALRPLEIHRTWPHLRTPKSPTPPPWHGMQPCRIPPYYTKRHRQPFAVQPNRWGGPRLLTPCGHVPRCSPADKCGDAFAVVFTPWLWLTSTAFLNLRRHRLSRSDALLLNALPTVGELMTYCLETSPRGLESVRLAT